MKRILRLLGAALLAYGLVRGYHRFFAPNGWRAYPLAVRAELRNAAEAQAIAADSTGAFAADLSTLPGFSTSDGVRITIVDRSESRLELRGSHVQLDPAVQCTLVVTRAPGTSATPGPVTCDKLTDWLGRPRLAR